MKWGMYWEESCEHLKKTYLYTLPGADNWHKCVKKKKTLIIILINNYVGMETTDMQVFPFKYISQDQLKYGTSIYWWRNWYGLRVFLYCTDENET